MSFDGVRLGRLGLKLGWRWRQLVVVLLWSRWGSRIVCPKRRRRLNVGLDSLGSALDVGQGNDRANVRLWDGGDSLVAGTGDARAMNGGNRRIHRRHDVRDRQTDVVKLPRLYLLWNVGRVARNGYGCLGRSAGGVRRIGG